MVNMMNYVVFVILIGSYNCLAETVVVVTEPEPSDDYQLSPESKLYKLHTEPLTWSSAARVCEREGGRLAVMESEVTSTFLTKLMLEGLPEMDSPVALLGYSRGSDRQFTTIAGKPLGSTGFNRMSHTGPELMGLKGGNCGSLHRDGGLSRFPCQTPAPFLCEKLNDTASTTTVATTQSTTTTTSAMSSLPGLGYELLSGLGWYKVHGDRKKWHDAVQACEAEGTHLAVLNSAAEANALKLMMAKQRGINYGICKCAFIGFHDLSREGHFVTVFGEPLNSTGFLVWGPGNPSNSGNDEDCGSITYRGDLNDLSCDEPYAFICEHSTGTASYNSSVNANATHYQPVYENYPGVGSYKLHTEGRDWNDAVETCNKEFAYLAIVNSDAESDVIRKLIGRNPDLELAEGKALFLGFEDADKDGNFKTIFGQPLNATGFLKWGKDSPSDPRDNSNCGGFDRSGRLVNVKCFLKAPFVCEQLTDEEKKEGPVGHPVKQPEPRDSYELHAGFGSYKLSLQRATWREAKKSCEDESAHLAIINSDQESELLRTIVGRIVHTELRSSIFLGFHDQTTEGRFETIFGKPLSATGFDKWAAWNPDNFGRGEDCGAMDKEGYLNDVPCDIKLPFFCERELNVTSSRSAYNASNRMSISPEHIHVGVNGKAVVTCTSEEPLIECHFKSTNGKVYDLSLGPLTVINPDLLNGDFSTYSYVGEGLQHGQCGMKFTLAPGLHRIMVGCRGRSLHGGWKYGYMSVHGSNAGVLSDVKAAAKEVLISNTTDPLLLVWQTSIPLTSCKCILPMQSMETRLLDAGDEDQSSASIDSYEDDINLDFDDSLLFVTPSAKISYHGLGFKSGQCGIQIRNPRAYNGYLWCGMGSPDKGWVWRSTAIIVEKPPGVPELVIHASEHSEGAILEAECTVGPSQPVANITWYLGDDIIRQDSVNDSPSVTWAWPSDEQSITQKLSRQMKAGDRGKELICEAGHFALPSGTLRTTKIISIEGSLLNRTFDVEEFGFVAGKPGFISIVITASPKPEITWHFDNITVKGGAQDPLGRFVAASLMKVNSLSIHWVAKLFISNVTEEDFSRDFYLTAKNEFGAQAYKVVIIRAKTTTVRPTEPPTTTPRVTSTQITTRRTTTTTRKTTTMYATTEDTSALTSVVETTSGYTEYLDPTADGTEAPLFEGNPVAPDAKTGWATSGSIAGIVIAILIVHLALAAVVIYGRRSGWRWMPLKARRRLLPSQSMNELVDQENSHQ